MIEKLEKLINGKTWNVKTKTDDQDNLVAEIYVGQVNYLDENNEWQEIDHRFIDTGTHFEMRKSTFSLELPKTARGIAKLTVNNRFRIVAKETILDAPFDTLIEAITAEDVPGVIEDDKIIYKNAYPKWNADLIYYAQHARVPRLRKLIRFNSPITEDVRIPFKISTPTDVVVHEWDKEIGEYKEYSKEKIVSDRGLAFRVGNTLRGFRQLSLRIWDSSYEIDDVRLAVDTYVPGNWDKVSWTRISAEIETDVDGSIIQTKIIPASFFTTDKLYPIYTDTVTTFFPDANPETTTVDGLTYRILSAGSGETLATLRQGAGNGSADSNPADTFVQWKADTSGTGYIQNVTPILGFDASAIPDTDTISTAILSLCN